MLYTEIDNLFLGDCPFLLSGLDEVVLIGDDDLWNFRGFNLIFNLLKPHLQILKTFALSHIEHYYHAVAFTVV
jgi:hypothetical protein